MYLGSQGSMPPADVAVRLAKVLDVTVEYLVTGEQYEGKPADRYKSLELDLDCLPGEVVESIKDMVHVLAASRAP